MSEEKKNNEYKGVVENGDTITHSLSSETMGRVRRPEPTSTSNTETKEK